MPSAAKLLAGASGVPTDPNFRNVTLLLHGDGSNGAQNNTFIDGSTNNFTITRNGNPTQGSFSPYGSRWSNYFDGTGDYLSVPTNAAFSFGTGDFTIECWLYMTSYGSANQNIIDFRGSTGTGTNIALYLENVGGTGTKQLRAYDGSGDAAATANNFALNTWTHVAITRSSNSFRFFVNGTQVGSTTTVSTNYSNTAGVFIGAYAGNSANFFGYLSDFRVVKGTAVYTAAFTPPITPLTAITNTSLLTCQSNRFRDASTNNFAITANGNASVFPFSPYAPTAPYSAATNGGSSYFPGAAGSYLSVPNNAAFQFGTGDLTIEAWIYISGDTITDPDGNRSATICSGIGGGGVFNDFWFNVTGNTTTTGTGLSFQVFNSGSGTVIFDTAYSFSKATWYHVAFTRSGNNVYLFVNGSLIASSTYSGTITAGTNAVNVGYGQTGSVNYRRPFFGYISNLRIVKGTAVYTAAFTPPTAPVTAITNTSLLVNGTNAAIIDSSADVDLETVGNAQISTSVKKFGTGSVYFDGTGDYLLTAVNPVFTFGTGDFTVETWVYLNAVTSTYNKNIVGTHYYSAGTGDRGWTFGVTATGQLTLFMGGSSGAGYQITGATTLTTGQWYHLAATRSGSTVRLFVNGTQDASGTSAYNEDYIGAGLKVATDEATSLSPSLGNPGVSINGYIDDLRITKGIARYTANFTPPTAAFPDQ